MSESKAMPLVEWMKQDAYRCGASTARTEGGVLAYASNVLAGSMGASLLSPAQQREVALTALTGWLHRQQGHAYARLRESYVDPAAGLVAT